MKLQLFKYTAQYLPTEEMFDREVYADSIETLRELIEMWNNQSRVWHYFISEKNTKENESLPIMTVNQLLPSTEYYIKDRRYWPNSTPMRFVTKPKTFDFLNKARQYDQE